jgi:hypothetical protein
LSGKAAKPFETAEIALAAVFRRNYQPLSPFLKLMSELRQPVEAPVGNGGRAALLGIAFFLLIGFGIALLLDPDPRGYGTHQKLGLPPCTFRLLFGRPCPGCGMTTSFSHFVRGQFVEAARANAAGTLLAAVCALLIPWCLWSARSGRLWMVADPVSVAGILSISLATLTVLMWVARVITVT